MAKRIIAIIAISIVIGLSVALAVVGFGAVEPAVEETSAQMRFCDGKFKILQLTDFHEWLGIAYGSLSFEEKDTLKPALEEYIDEVLEQEKPDLVVLTGDNIFSLGFVADLAKRVSEKTYIRFAEIFEEKKQHWTMTFGNHDSESALGKDDFLNAVKPYKYFVGGSDDAAAEVYKYFEMDITGTANKRDRRLGNFSIPVYDENNAAKYNIFLLDSGSFESVPSSSIPYRYILPEQTAWYLKCAAELKEANGGNVVPSLLFTHIPLLEHREAYEQNGVSMGFYAGISPSDVRSDIFEKAMDFGDIRGIFTGHNHQNSITCFYTRGSRKIMMGVTPQCCVEDYADTDGSFRGRVITVYENGDFSTYITERGVAKPQAMSYNDGLL